MRLSARAKDIRAEQRQLDRSVDGPLHTTVRGFTCEECGRSDIDDMYMWNHQVLCGDCRYEARTGKTPPVRPSTYGHSGGEAAFHDMQYHGFISGEW